MKIPTTAFGRPVGAEGRLEHDRVGALACLALAVVIFAAQAVVSQGWLARFHAGPDEGWLRAWISGRQPKFWRARMAGSRAARQSHAES